MGVPIIEDSVFTLHGSLTTKFIVAIVASKDSSGEKFVLRADSSAQKFKEIFGLLEDECHYFNIDFRRGIGHGIITIQPEEKQILVLDLTTNLGFQPDLRLTEALIKNEFPDFKVIFENAGT